MLKRITSLTAFILVLHFSALAQITTSSITGTVSGVADDKLNGATISAIHLPSGTKYSTSARGSGQFAIQNMRVGGPYVIEISFVGFQTEKLEDVYLKLAEVFLVTSTLKKMEGNLENVVITTTGRKNPILNAQRTGAVTNIGRRDIERLPSISRSINDLTRATPQSNGQSIAGGNYRQNNFTVDGSDFNNSFGIGGNLPANGSPISLDALDEISVNVTPFDIRQTGFIGGAINAVTRSGTNKFQGSLYTYFRDETSRGDQVDKVTFIRPIEKFNQKGVRFGGPILKNKLFFFFNYETEEQPKAIQTRFAATASAAFGSAPNIARPTATELNAISDYLRNNYGYETGPFDNYTPSITRKKYLGRLDWNISKKHRMNVRYSQVEGGEPNPPSTSTTGTGNTFPTGSGRTDNNALWFKNSNYFQGANFYSLAAEVNSQFGRNLFNTFRGTYTFQNDSRETESSVFPFVDILSAGTPFTSFGYEPFSFGNLRKVKTFSFVDNVNFRINKHNWLLGAQVERNETINGFQRFATSYYRFNSWADFVSALDPNPANRVKPTDFAYTYSLSKGFAPAFSSFKLHQVSFYAQDEISVNKKFRLTVGVRADRLAYPEIEQIQTNPLVSGLTFANGEKLNTGVLPKDKLMWSPRIGFNWDMNGDRTLQIRGGTGIFTGKVPAVWVVSQSGDAGMIQVTQSFNTPASVPGPFNPNPAAYLPSTVPAKGTIIPSAITVLDPDFKNPQTWKTSLAMDANLGKGFILTLEGILDKDINAVYFRNPNLIAPLPLSVSGYPDNRLIYGATTATRFINQLTASGQPGGTNQFNPIVIDNQNKGFYASFTARLEKQFKGGFYGFIAYTKSLSNKTFDGGGDQPLSAWQGAATVDGANKPLLSSADYVIPDRILAALSYRKEYLKHLGTTVSLIYEGRIQGRFSYTYSADFNRDLVNADLIYIPKAGEMLATDFVALTTNGVTYSGTQQLDLFNAYIEQDRYLRKHRGQYAERNGAIIPWRNQIDMKILQDLFINIGKQRNTIQFSFDVFNVLNLINPAWGKIRTVNTPSILVPQNVASLVAGGTTRPTFRLATDRNNPANATFRDNVSTASTYFMQFGFRYLFN